ncbi:MAG: hypothetical protein ABJF10_06805 [Chthoniobacter sp.]|uniref:hypothetical protein n=1 Tax=Chthoniobacter sp. TaxID=2510640 RepID=UPI0032A65B74
MGESTRTLADGREISLVSFFFKNLAANFSAGIAQTILDEHAMAIAKRIWPDEPCELLPTNSSIPPDLSTQFLCMGEFVSYTPLPGSQECASSLIVIWFQAGLSLEFEKIALAHLPAIDWNKKAKEFSW